MLITIGHNVNTDSWFAWNPQHKCFYKDLTWNEDSCRENRNSKRELISDLRKKYNLYKSGEHGRYGAVSYKAVEKKNFKLNAE